MRFKKLLENPGTQWLYPVAILAVGLLAYTAVLIIGIPSQINLIILSARNSTFLLISLFIGIVLLLYLAFRPSGWIGTFTSFSATLILFATQLSAVWRSSAVPRAGGHYILGGLLPMSDASSYYGSALRLLEGDTFSGSASYRPLSHGVLATLLGLTQQNLQLTLAILVLITAIACFLFAREVQHSHGTVAGVLVLVTVFIFYRPYIGTAMTENLGLALGAAGLAILWRGAINKTINLCLLGIFLLTLALNTRAGAFFILPALLLWGAWSFRGASRFSQRFLIGGVSAILLGFIVNSIVFKATASPNAATNANFSYVLYGLIVGGKWDTVFTDYPELLSLSLAERSQRVYELAFEALRANPFALVIGFIRAWKQFLFDNFVFSFVPSAKVNITLRVLSLVAIVNCYRQRQNPSASLMIAAFIGILLSVPLVPPWDTGTRAYAATIPFFSLFPALGLIFIARKYKWQQLLQVPAHKGFPPVLWIFGIALALLTFAGPIVTKILSRPPQFSEISCLVGTEAVYFRNSPGSSINLVPDSAIKRTNVPNIRLSDFKTGLHKLPSQYAQITQELAHLSPNTTLFQKINLKNGRTVNMIVDSKLIPEDRGIVAACLKRKPIPIVRTNGRVSKSTIYYADSMTLVSR